jgi:hypothetical protein
VRWPVYAVAADGRLVLPLDDGDEPIDLLMGLRADGLPALQLGDRTARFPDPLGVAASAVWREVIARALRARGEL